MAKLKFCVLARVLVILAACWFSSSAAESASCSLGEYACETSEGSDHRRCLPQSWKCDGEADCPNGDDEKHCDCASKSEHKCALEFRCIPHGWVCDGHPDCKNGTDELNCTLSECNRQNEFRCSDFSQCITKRWVCDGKKDCRDGSDEANCRTQWAAHRCSATHWKCDVHEGKQQCIPKTAICDGLRDCADGSDEDFMGCHRSVECHIRSDFHCGGSSNPPECIHKLWVCDGTKDCLTGADERHCHDSGTLTEDDHAAIHAQPVCHPDSEFRCLNPGSGGQHCINITSFCDGIVNCADGSDETAICRGSSDCNLETQFSCLSRGENETTALIHSICKPLELMCDGKRDCLNGFDEWDKTCALPVSASSSNPCDLNPCGESSGVSCVPTHMRPGYYCRCATGYSFNLTNMSCEDVDECAHDAAVCSQVCTNTIGSYKCSCFDGYVKISHAGCASVDAPSLLYANRKTIRVFRFDNKLHSELAFGPSAVGLDYGYDHNLLVWSDTLQGQANLYWRHFNGTIPDDPASKNAYFNISVGNPSSFRRSDSNDDVSSFRPTSAVLHPNISTPDGVAYDWIHSNLYWTDTGTKTVSVLNVKYLWSHTLFTSDLDEPRAIVVDPLEGYMYWTDWGSSPKIERAGMDGSDRKTIVSNLPNEMILQWPNGLAFDRVDRRLYWSDARLHRIASCNLDGSDLRTVVQSGTYLSHPFAVEVFGDFVYWSDWNLQRILVANKLNGRIEPDQLSIMGQTDNSTMDIKIYHRLKQPPGEDRCPERLPGTPFCSHMCLPSPLDTSHTGMRLARRSSLPSYHKYPVRYSCACPLPYSLMTDEHTCNFPGAQAYPWHDSSDTPDDEDDPPVTLILVILISIIGALIAIVVIRAARSLSTSPHGVSSATGVYASTTEPILGNGVFEGATEPSCSNSLINE